MVTGRATLRTSQRGWWQVELEKSSEDGEQQNCMTGSEDGGRHRTLYQAGSVKTKEKAVRLVADRAG